jgi:hypothetical protein
MAADLWGEVKVLVVYPAVVDTELFSIPGNDPLPGGLDAITVDDLVDAVLGALGRDQVEVYVPAFFKEIATGRAANVAGFIEGAAAFVRQQQASETSGA